MPDRPLSFHSQVLGNRLARWLTVLILVGAGSAAAAASAANEPGTIFRFRTDGFWLNLHHFLYVLGRAEAKLPDIERRAVVNAPSDQERGLRTLPLEQQESWRAAVSIYARGPSQLDAVFDEQLVTAAGNLVKAGDSLDGVDLEDSWASALQQAAPIYRQVWWPEHHSANRDWVEEIQPLLEKHGKPVLDFVTRASGLPWPVAGFPVQISGYSNWAGAYSTEVNLLVISSLDRELRGTTTGLEVVFHEAMHQWDQANLEALVTAARAQQVRFPRGLDHAMLFFTAGEAVRTVIPEHVPYAQQYGIWQRRLGQFLPMLEAAWRPYLHGLVSRDRALANLMGHFQKPPQE